MPMDRQAERLIAASLAQSAESPATSSQVADVAVAAWMAIEAALRPIVGHRGIAALYKRSIHLNCKDHPCLGVVMAGADLSLDTAPLKSALDGCSADEAAATGAAVFQTFYELLTTLIGSSLTERLLRPVWANFLSGSPAQDH
jgi:hypothetical protein